MTELAPRLEDRFLNEEEDHDGERRGQKSADAYRTISEVADDLKVPQHVLRFWESKFKQITPMKRAGGRRFYRPQDVDLIKRIHYLLYTQGYTIKGVQKLLVKDRQLVRSVPALNEDEASVSVVESPVTHAAYESPVTITGASVSTHAMPEMLATEQKRRAELQLLLKRLKELRGQIAL